MGDHKTVTVSSLEEQRAQMESPTPETLWARAHEVFGDEQKAKSWMQSRRAIFDSNSPEELALSGDADQMRKVLVILGRIENGIPS
jgi:uncharacterized protein (DUF2384 family)